MAQQKMNVEQVKHMYLNEHKSTPQIARELNCSQAGVYLLLKREKVPLRGKSEAAGSRTLKSFGFAPTKEWLVQAMAFFNGNAMECARHYNFVYSTLIDHLDRHGISRLAPADRRQVGAPRKEIPIAEAISLSNAGWTYASIAEKFSVPTGVVTRRMKEAGHHSPRDKHRKDHSGKKRTLVPTKWRVLQELSASGISCCEICGEARGLDLAHIKANKLGGPMTRENVLALCPTHHRYFDHGKLTREEFSKISSRVRAAEALYSFVHPLCVGF